MFPKLMKLAKTIKALIPAFADSRSLWAESDVLIARGNHRKAMAIYRRLSRRAPQDPEGYQYSALSEYRLNNPEASLDILEAGLDRFPEARDGFLFEHYLRISAQLGQIGRAMRYVRPGVTDAQACAVFLDAQITDPNVRVGLVEYCLANGLTELGEQNLRFIRDNCDDPALLWKLADVLEAHGHSVEAQAIYRRLSEHELKCYEDYYYASVTELRLGNPEKCMEIIEREQRKYPQTTHLCTLYLQLCATRLDFERYRRFVKESGLVDVVAPDSRLAFYKQTFESGAPEIFATNFKDIELRCEADTFRFLKSEFLSFLSRKPPSVAQAKVIMFFSGYLDTDAEFASRLFDVLRGMHGGETGDAECARYALLLLYMLTPPMVPHYDIPAATRIQGFIDACSSLSKVAVRLDDPIRDMTNNWTPWQYIFCLGAPGLYHKAISGFEQVAFAAWPKLNYTASHTCELWKAPARAAKRKIRIGFIVHDSMPMMSGLMARLDKSTFETTYLRPGKPGSSKAAQDWIARAERTVEYSDEDICSALETIASQELDIIISGPSIAAVFYPMMARLAHLQMVLLEPNWTDGLANADYYISWQPAEPANPADYYKSAVSFLQHPPYWIEKPELGAGFPLSQEMRNDVRRRLLGLGPESQIYLCANTPPKIHPSMDGVFRELLELDPDATLVLLRGDYPPTKALKIRLREELGRCYDRVVFLPTLDKQDAHLLLQAVDCCLDSFPLSGMSSSFDGAMLGVPLVTFPSDTPFGRWTAAMYEYIGVSGLTAENRQGYIDIAMRLARDKEWRNRLSLKIKEKSARYVESEAAFDEFQDFIVRSWHRKLSGLPKANWMSGCWQ